MEGTAAISSSTSNPSALSPASSAPFSTSYSASASPSVVIDHTAFPHILTTILSHSSRSTLLTFRQTCKYLRDEADILLAAHLQLEAGINTPPSLSARSGRLPILRRRRAGLKGCESVYARSHSAVVDIVGAVGTYPRSPVISRLNALGGVRMARMRHAPGGRLANACVLKAREVVVFTTITERDRNPHGVEMYVPAVADTVSVPPGTEKLVLNIRYDPNRPWLSETMVAPFSMPASCTDLVVIFTEKATHREPQVGGGEWSARRPGGMLNTLLRILVQRVVTATFVDTNKLRRSWLGVEQDVGVEEGIRHALERVAVQVYLDGEARMSMFREGVHPYGPHTAPPTPPPTTSHSALATAAEAATAIIDTGEEPPRTLTFMSRDEYRALVGEEAFALETVE